MENPFSKVMADKSAEHLYSVVSKPGQYEPEAIIAAIEQLELRGLATQELLQQKIQTRQMIYDRDRAADEAQQQLRADAKRSRGEALALFKPTRHYFYTPIILYLNILIWLIMVAGGVGAFEPSSLDLLNWGGNLRSSTLGGEPWRLFTSTFIHGGLIHLALNMYALMQVGALLEIKFGNHRFLLCYVATGILASIASIAFHENIVSVGASGAIFGLFGLLFSLLVTKNIDIPLEARKNLLSSTGIFIVYNLVFGFTIPGIDNAAHIGGLVSGFLIGIAYLPTARQPERSKIVSIVIGLIVVAAVILAPRFISN